MNETFEKTTEQAAAFQKLWMDSSAKIIQAALTVSPGSPPPELLRHMRNGIFQALAESWDEFMRSPQFTETMRSWMESAISFRKLSNEFLGKVRTELQAPSRDDMDTVVLTVRHMEKRLLDRLDELSAQLGGGNHTRRPAPPHRRARQRPAPKQRRPARNAPAKSPPAMASAGPPAFNPQPVSL